jgi:hypothetical protein
MKIGLVACYPQSHKDFFSSYASLCSLENAFKNEGVPTEVFTAATLESPTAVDEVDRLVLIGNPFEDPRGNWSEWLVSARPELAAKITIVGIKGFVASKVLETHQEILKKIAKEQPIAVCDAGSREELAKVVGNKGVVLTGPLAYWIDGKPLRLKKKTRLFVPSATDPVFHKSTRSYKSLVRKFYRRWSQATPAIYCGVHFDGLDLAAAPGEAAFFQPTAPSLLKTALVSADAVVGGHTALLLVATQNSVPAVLLSNDPTEKKIAESLGIPFLESHGNTQAAELVHRTEEILAKYPWDTVRQKSSKLINKASEFLIEAKLLKKVAIGKKKSQQPSADRHWATVASDDSLGSVLGWVENIFSIYEGRNHFHILCASRAVEAALETALRPGSWTSYSLRDLWQEDEWLVCRRNGLRSAFSASKPRFLLQVLAAIKGEVFFSEPEVLFFRDPAELSPPAECPAVLVARYSDSQTETRARGLYSGALFTVQPQAEDFLNWWSSVAVEALGRNNVRYEEGEVLSSAPLLFPTIQVVRDATVLGDAANLQSTSVARPHWPGDMLYGFDGSVVAAFSCREVDALRIHEIKSGWDQLAAVFTQTKRVFQNDCFRVQVWSQQRLNWPKVDDFFRVKEWTENHFPVLVHTATPGELRFFSKGLGRSFIRLVVALGIAAPPFGNARPKTTEHETVWSQWQKTLLRARFASMSPSSRHNQVA